MKSKKKKEPAWLKAWRLKKQLDAEFKTAVSKDKESEHVNKGNRVGV